MVHIELFDIPFIAVNMQSIFPAHTKTTKHYEGTVLAYATQGMLESELIEGIECVRKQFTNQEVM